MPGPTKTTGVEGDDGITRVGADKPIGSLVPETVSTLSAEQDRGTLNIPTGKLSSHDEQSPRRGILRLVLYSTRAMRSWTLPGCAFCISLDQLPTMYALTSLELAIENCLLLRGGNISHRYSFGNLISLKSPNVSTIVRLGRVA